MRKIFILSCWRSGTSWIEDILGKEVKDSFLFGHEQQILPLLYMYKKTFYTSSYKTRQKANKPVCDIEKDNFYQELGFKQHKMLRNAHQFSGEDFSSFALRFLNFLLYPYEQKYKQVVEKTPESGSPDVFNFTIDLLSNLDDYILIYLVRDFKAYLSSCYEKFVMIGDHDVLYFTKKWLLWNTNAINKLKNNKAKNIFILSYEDLVNNPKIIENITPIWKKNTYVRPFTLNKWKSSPIVKDINDIYKENKKQIKQIEEFIQKNKVI